MDRFQKVIVSAVCISASSGLLITQRSLLLTDAYKFPFPLTSAFFGLSASLVLCSALYILLQLLAFALSFSPAFGLKPGPVDCFCGHCSQQSGVPEPPYLPYKPGVSSRSWRSRRLARAEDEDGTRARRRAPTTWVSRLCCFLSPNRTQISCQLYLGFAVVVRLSVGVVLFSHVSFLKYTVIALLTLPITIAFNYCGESACSLLLSISEMFLLLALVLPRVHFSFSGIDLCSIALPVMDSIVIIAGLKAFRPPWHENLEQQQPFLLWWTRRSNITRLIQTYTSAAQRLVCKLTLALAAATVAMLPLLKLSGELTDVTTNCYISGQSQFILRLCSLGALYFAVLIGFALASTVVTPIFIASMLPSIHAVIMAATYHRILAPMDWTHLTLCWVLMLVRLLRDEDDAEGGKRSSYKGHRGIWRVLRRIFLSMVIYAVVLQACFTFKEYIRTGSIAMLVEPEKTPVVPEAFIPPEKLVGLEDAYLGQRPEPDARLEWSELMKHCADSVGGLPVEDIVQCLQYLSRNESEYMSTGASARAYAAKQLLLPHPQQNDAKAVQKTKCDGPQHVYHTYWTGSASWRVELFIKAYLYSQNLSCSRLWIWLDADTNPRALEQMLYHDARFQRFHNLLDEGYIELKAWTFPQELPLPELAETDPMYHKPGAPLPHGLMRDDSGDLFLVLDQLHKTVSTPTQISDLVRFVVLHLHGGLYLDMDVLLLRDLRPFLLPDQSSPIPDQQPAWAEQWVEQITNPGDYNTAVLSLPANSSLSSYLLQGGRRMGMNFHPRVLGLMIWKDGRKDELAMLHNAVFDPLVTNLRRKRTDTCTVPCHKNFEAAFMTDVEDPEREWSNFDGKVTETKDLAAAMDEDHLPSNTNRTMANFFRGAFAYHVHNQWQKFPEPASWMDVITQTQDGFFAGKRSNAYGEMWGGPRLDSYDRSEWTR